MPRAHSRAREMGIGPGTLLPGRFNAITDVDGVRVGHVTVIEGPDIRTGATAILPHGGNLYRERVPAGVDVANGYGKMMGTTQIVELGEIETPIVLTNTLAVPRAADAVIDWVLRQPGCETVRSVNPVVGETNDGTLNAIHRRVLTPAIIRRALDNTATGRVPEGCVGGGTGTIALGFKAGIGTASRVLPESSGGHTVGVLVQSNFSGILRILGTPIGALLETRRRPEPPRDAEEHGSIMVVVATDAPLSDRNLRRLARRSFAGLACTGSHFSDGSGDYALAFSTHPAVRRSPTGDRRSVVELTNEAVSSLFRATIEAAEEAVYNSLFAATSMTGNGRTVEALPVDRVVEMLSPVPGFGSGRHA